MTSDAPRDAFIELPPREAFAEERHGYNFGFVANMGRLLRAHPRIGPRFIALFGEIMFSPEGALDRREREMIAAVAAAAQDCHY
ncbi:MAG TPA: carboxymuconolactone decarboxylase family protein [Thermoanaerobaculia bacterium]|nr:carboxymuconolactone decarboxylase family protein [Thermoanaerobaculia bacterium]